MKEEVRRSHFLIGLLVAMGLLAACAPQSWKQDPDVQAAKRDCAGLPQGEHYACIERYAVDRLNPDVCRLAGMWVDDMCLQAVYEAADDPTICDRLYLEGVRPTCHACYASLEATAAPPSTPLALTETYTDTTLGLALDYPAGWRVDAVADGFVHLYAPTPYTSTVGVVRYPQPSGATMDTVLDGVLQGGEGPRVTHRQTLTVGGQPAVQVFFGPPEDWRPDTVILVAGPAGDWWTIYGRGELAIFHQIVGTLRWLPRDLSAPTAIPQPTATAIRTPPATIEPSPTTAPQPAPTQPPESKFPRTEAWFAAYGNEFPTDEQMQQLADAFSADVVTYLEKAITPTVPLEDQASALARMAADLPGFEGGQVVPVNLDNIAEAELFIVPMLNGGPLLYARHTPAGWQMVPMPVVPPGEKEAAAAAPNLWPHSAEARDVTGDGHPEAVTIHTLSGASNWREHPQILRWDGEAFTILFRAELVNWAGPSQWHFEPYGNGQDIVLHYPHFYPTGFEAKMIAHPQATQRWRWDPSLERYALQETSCDLESILADGEGVPEWELLRVLVNEAELRYQAGDLEEALAGYQDVVTRAADMERPKERAPHWPAYARFRIAQVQALLGQAKAAQAELSRLLADLDEESNLRPLVQAFDETYDPTQPDGALRAMAALHGLRLYEQFYWHDDRPGDLTFPMSMVPLLWPGTPLARYLDAHPEAVDGPPSSEREQALLHALSDLGFPVTDVRIAELNGDGLAEVLVTTDETDQHNGPRCIWLLTQTGGHWHSHRPPRSCCCTEGLTEQPLPDGRIVLQWRDPSVEEKSAFVWTGETLIEVDPESYEPLLPWPVVGWPDA